MDSSLIITLLLLFTAAIVGGLIAKKLRQPTLLGYIAAGILVGNLAGSFIAKGSVLAISDIGMTLLLFTLGLEFSFHRINKLLTNIFWSAATQIVATTVIFFGILILFGFEFLPALFFAIACSLSSTAIIVKILSDRGELETVPGEIAAGWSVIQDLSVIPIMFLLPIVATLSLSESVTLTPTILTLGLTICKALAAIILVILLGRFGIPKLLNLVASWSNREVLIITTVTIVALSALFFQLAGLSIALGAFVAGLLVADTSQHHAIFAEIRPLRDLFVVIFFVSLGMSMPAALLIKWLPQLLGMGLFIIIIKAGVIYLLARFMRFHRKTAFLVALTLTQISEFAFIIGKLGVSSGALVEDQYLFLVALTCFTILVTTPVIAYAPALYYGLQRKFGKWLPHIFPPGFETGQPDSGLPIRNHVVICGYGRVGKYIGRALELNNVPYVVVEYNHTIVGKLKELNIPVLYGDPAELGVLDYAQVDHARAIVIAIPDRATQELVIANAQTLNRSIKIICRSHYEEDRTRLKTLGVTTVIQPEFEAALSVVRQLLPNFGIPSTQIPPTLTQLKIEHGMG